ncbi:MAG: UDP-3-O-(3-hydroxymyristoyl)glucosamine N-acyltransferase [Flammeovirgaceae bacterium]
MKFSVNDIAKMLGGEVRGNGNLFISKAAKIQDGEEGSIAFLANMKYEEFIYSTKATAVIVNQDFVPKQEVKATMIVVKDAYASFATLLDVYQKLLENNKKGIEQPSFISSTASLGENIYVGAFVYIADNVKIGKNVKIYPHTYIGEGTSIGDNCSIHAGVKIYRNSVIGNDCTIQAGAVIGSEGFGFAPQTDGTYKTVPQIGNVVIEDNVDIGANTTIDRATIGSTIIRKGVKLDNLIQVAHNVIIGEHTVIAAQSGISGSTEIGKNAMIAGQVGFAGHIKIGDNAKIAAQSGISKSFEENGVVLMGAPAYDLKEYMKSYAAFRNLPELTKIVRDLQKSVEELKNK